MYLVKTNEIAQHFSERDGFKTLSSWLDRHAVADHQVAYNVVCTLWTLSYHDFALKYFEDLNLNLIEKSLRILDYFNKEKIVRIILLFIDNLKMKPSCHEIISDLNAIQTIAKLQNRHWVDEDITDMLEKIWGYLDEHYQVFSSIDKFRKESKKKQIRWGPVHTEKFWQENHIFFNENLDIIKHLVTRVEAMQDDDATLAVICFDLGEFARFADYGRNMLIAIHLKDFLTKIMQKPNSSAELKKEGITCY